MAFDPLNLKQASSAFEQSLNRVIDERVAPLVDRSIHQVSNELSEVIRQAGEQVDRNIALLSDEIHSQRSMTKDDIRELIDYSTAQIGAAIDQRILAIKHETSTLINEKVDLLKCELEDAAVNSRKTMYANVAISIGAAVLMALVGLAYKKISMGELNLLNVFRVTLLSCATFTFVLSMLKFIQRWRSMKRVKKGMATVAIGYLGILRPNGATGLLVLSVCLMAGWAWLYLGKIWF
ncbi:hypothetical protein UNDYM_3381 [Undibacterium sp. YM2]|uniref:hypothetical protein n=1 Tax=Undibacterium sp. YM2 TaxID=2058625 RepID=UPI001331F41D|nr:hypothetical protein [Undibacterium sp. YM2]BBB67634.1 hypothetical protein UNDYM_3381 [Undibacterium sp. YM2]